MTDSLTPTQVFKCLADENRIRMMLLIAREEELCVCELTCALMKANRRCLATWLSCVPVGYWKTAGKASGCTTDCIQNCPPGYARFS